MFVDDESDIDGGADHRANYSRGSRHDAGSGHAHADRDQRGQPNCYRRDDGNAI
jgi:hypothetical protein